MVRHIRSAVLFAALLSLQACQGGPPLQAGPEAIAPAHEMGELVLAPAWGRRVAEVGLYSRYSIDHLTLKLFKVSGATETLVTSLDVAQADLDLPVKFSDLLANTTYRVRAYAYKAAGSAASDLISTEDDRSMVEVVVASGNPTIAALKVRLVDRYWPKVSTLAGDGTKNSKDGLLSAAQLDTPQGIAIASTGTIYFSEGGTPGKIRRIKDGQVDTIATGAAGVAFNLPYNLAVDRHDNVIVADLRGDRIVKITPEGVASVLAGPGAATVGGAAASFNDPSGVAVDAADNVYVADAGNNQIRKIAPDGTVSTVAGAGGADDFLDHTDPLQARFAYPAAVAVNAQGVIYVADSSNCLIRKITSAGVSTVAGQTGAFDFADGTGTAAMFSFPTGLTLDKGGNLYVGDNFTFRVRKVTPDGLVTTVAGTGDETPFADNPATNAVQSVATFGYPSGLAFDAQGALYVIDTSNQRIRKIQ